MDFKSHVPAASRDLPITHLFICSVVYRTVYLSLQIYLFTYPSKRIQFFPIPLIPKIRNNRSWSKTLSRYLFTYRSSAYLFWISIHLFISLATRITKRIHSSLLSRSKARINSRRPNGEETANSRTEPTFLHQCRPAGISRRSPEE